MAIDPQTTDTVTIPQLDPLVLALESFLVGANADGKMGNFTAHQLAEFIAPYISALGSSPFVANTGSPLPNPIEKPTAITFVGAGTFDQTTGADVVTTEELNVLFWSSNGTTGTWTIGVAIPIVLTDYTLNSDFLPVKALTENLPPQNIYRNKLEDTYTGYTDNLALLFPNNGYITNTGAIATTIPNFKHTNKYPIPTGTTKIKVNYTSTYGIAFYDASNAFISTLGDSTSGGVFDKEITIPVGATQFVQNMPTKYLPGGTDFAIHPQYLYAYAPSSRYSFPWLKVLQSNIIGSSLSVENTFDTTNVATSFPTVGYIDNVGAIITTLPLHHTAEITIPTGKTIVKCSYAATYAVAFYDAAHVFISTLGSGVPAGTFDVVITIPATAKYLKYNMGDSYLPGGANNAAHPPYLYFGIQENKYSFPWLKVLQSNLSTTNEKWVGKKIAWYGTSIPAGYPKQADQNTWSYANKTAIALGATINNKCVPNGVIRSATSSGGSMGSRDALSFTRLTSAINYQNSMVDLIGTINEPDLFVFDYGVNDESVDPSDVNAYASFVMTSEDTTKFMGALNFVFKKLYTANKRARAAIITHYSNDSNSTSSFYININKAIERVADYWGIPVLRVYEKNGWANKNGINIITEMCPDGVHPASMTTTFSVDLLAGIMTSFINKL